MMVITYQHAHLKSEHTLCAKCAAEGSRALARIGTLGAVSHGRHQGSCEGCDPQIILGGIISRWGIGLESCEERGYDGHRIPVGALSQPERRALSAALIEEGWLPSGLIEDEDGDYIEIARA